MLRSIGVTKFFYHKTFSFKFFILYIFLIFLINKTSLDNACNVTLAWLR